VLGILCASTPLREPFCKVFRTDPAAYAVVKFTEGKMNMQIWDFVVKAAK
jgi:hypothetical protein